MGFLDRLFGTNSDSEYRETTNKVRAASAARSEDEVAVERYRYLLRTAPPETIEKVHEEAFTKLSPEQRKMLFTQLSADAPRGEAPKADDAHSLAVSATRSEMRKPGTMEKSLGNVSAAGAGPTGAAPGFGSMFGSSLLGSIAGYVIASTLMSAFLPSFAGDSGAADTSQAGSEGGDGSGDAGAGDGSGEFASADGGFDDGGFDGGGFDGGGFGDFGL